MAPKPHAGKEGAGRGGETRPGLDVSEGQLGAGPIGEPDGTPGGKPRPLALDGSVEREVWERESTHASKTGGGAWSAHPCYQRPLRLQAWRTPGKPTGRGAA